MSDHQVGRIPILTPEIHREVVSYITAGAFDHIAARAAGLSDRTFTRYMERGRAADAWEPPEDAHEFQGAEGRRAKCEICGKTRRVPHGIPERPDEMFWLFWRDVLEARAKARVVAETRVASENPLAWLRMGPGRHKGDADPGWTDRVEVVVDPPEETARRIVERVAADLSMDPEVVAKIAEGVAARL